MKSEWSQQSTVNNQNTEDDLEILLPILSITVITPLLSTRDWATSAWPTTKSTGVRTATGWNQKRTVATVLPHENSGTLHLGWVPPQNLAITSPHFSLQLSIWVLIVSWHDQYVDCAVLAALSPPTFRYAIQWIFAEWRMIPREFRFQLAIIPQPLNENQSDSKSDTGKWKSA
jgi:hypothetical protein